jgi:hypothetical protein
MSDAHKTNALFAFGTLLATTGTLVCCVLPAVLVSIGAGAVLVGLVSAVPQLVWLSEHKALVFGIAGALLVISGALIWRARTLPCPVDPVAARSCIRLRRINGVVYGMAVGGFLIGALFAFVLPLLSI